MSTPTPVEPADPAKKTSQILDPSADDATVQMSRQDEKCFWNDVEFSHGDRVSVDGTCYECNFGSWIARDD